MSRTPVVLVPACNRWLGDHAFHIAGRKYVDAVRLAGALPLVVPRLEPGEIDEALDLAHGVLLTGSPSNVHPSAFGEAVHDPSLPLITRALVRGVPLFGICRGTQEVNVALGGTLHQAVQEVDGLADHRASETLPVDLQYAPTHGVEVVGGGLLEAIVGRPGFEVNSLHGQGVKSLAAGLRVEAVAPDGLVEAFSMPGAAGFNLCVQWHPEWHAADNPVSMLLFQAFGAAVRQYRDRARVPLPGSAALA